MLTIGCHMSVAKGFEKMGLTAVKSELIRFSFLRGIPEEARRRN